MNSPAIHERDGGPVDSPAQADRVDQRPQQLVEHFFRRQSARLTAVLTRVLGVRRLDLVEDVVQGAFLMALRSWGGRGIPDDPAAWLFRVAKNLAVDALRRERLEGRVLPRLAGSVLAQDELLHRVELADEIADDQLRLLCLCCHPVLPLEAQVAFALKMMCGFSAREIARALLMSEASAQKRVVRAKERLRGEKVDVTLEDLGQRHSAILSVIYLLFNEGYYSSGADRLIKVELCEEALRLGGVLTEHAPGRSPAACALMALMSLHAARFAARQDDHGSMLLLEQQDRSKWDARLLSEGMRWLAEAASGDVLSPYHLEAGIAWEHCLASTFAQTNWPRILDMYDLLLKVRPTALARLNRAIAIAHVHGDAAALAAMAEVDAADVPRDYYLWDATLGELHRRAGHVTEARRHFESALARTPSPFEQELLRARLDSCQP